MAAQLTGMDFSAENGKGLVPAVAGEADDHGRQAHRERQATRQLDVCPEQQDQRRDEQLAPGDAKDGGDHPDHESGGHARHQLSHAGEQRRPAVTSWPAAGEMPHQNMLCCYGNFGKGQRATTYPMCLSSGTGLRGDWAAVPAKFVGAAFRRAETGAVGRLLGTGDGDTVDQAGITGPGIGGLGAVTS
jgi:hypothetical protein